MASGRITALDAQVRNSTKEAFGTLNDIQQEALVLDSAITEEETRILHGFTRGYVGYDRFLNQTYIGFVNNRTTRCQQRSISCKQRARTFISTGKTIRNYSF